MVSVAITASARPLGMRVIAVFLALLVFGAATGAGAINTISPDDQLQIIQDKLDSVALVVPTFIPQTFGAVVRLLHEEVPSWSEPPVIISHTYRGPPVLS